MANIRNKITIAIQT